MHYCTAENHVYGIRVFGCKVEAKIGTTHLAQLEERMEDSYYIGTTTTKAVI